MNQAEREYRKRNALLLDMGYASYGEYLASPLWRQIRTRIFKRDGWQCVVCGSAADAVHHLRYHRAVLLGQADHHLVAICEQCHTRAEFKGGRKASPSEARKAVLAVAEKPRRGKRRPTAKRRQKRRQKMWQRDVLPRNAVQPYDDPKPPAPEFHRAAVPAKINQRAEMPAVPSPLARLRKPTR